LLQFRPGVLKLVAAPTLGGQKICKGGVNNLVIVFVMKTSKEIKIHRWIFYAIFSGRITNQLSPWVSNLIFLSWCGQPVIAFIFFQMDRECNKVSQKAK